jgi:D-alanyl-D-alanine carboxypeptidase (penicillin-binding protein 5/6)
VEELLYATALVSANDAAVALAEYVAGSEEDFTRLMNAKAEELGLEDTNYVDCTGLLSIFSNNYSTAFDQVRLLQVALDHELFRTILATPDYYIESRDRKIKNSHPLLDRGGVEGGKTGATTPAGHTLITACTRQEKRLIIVVLGARSREVRNRENEALVEWAFGNLRTVISSEEVITPVLIPDGVDHQVNAVLAREFQVVALEEANLEYETEPVILPDLRAPIDRGDKVGELVVSQGGEEFVRLDLVAAQSTGLATWLRRLFNGVNRVFRGGGG